MKQCAFLHAICSFSALCEATGSFADLCVSPIQTHDDCQQVLHHVSLMT